MGLDFVVLMREDDDSPENWPGHEIDARRADDPRPEVQKKVRAIYDSLYSEAAMAQTASFQGWPTFSRPQSGADWVFVPLGFVLGLPAAYLLCLFGKFQDSRRERPSFEDWRAELISNDPTPVVIMFGPNCPEDAIPEVAAAVQGYGFRGQVVQPGYNALAAWWHNRFNFDLDLVYYGDNGFADGPPTGPYLQDELEPHTIGDMANLFQRMADDCARAFPEIAAAADMLFERRRREAAALEAEAAEASDVVTGPEHNDINEAAAKIEAGVEATQRDDDSEDSADDNIERPFGPFPDRDLDNAAYADELLDIRGAARFFRFWQGRGYAITPDF